MIGLVLDLVTRLGSPVCVILATLAPEKAEIFLLMAIVTAIWDNTEEMRRNA